MQHTVVGSIFIRTSVDSNVSLQVEFLVEFSIALLALKQSLLGLVHLIVHFTNMTNHGASGFERQAAADAIMEASLKQ